MRTIVLLFAGLLACGVAGAQDARCSPGAGKARPAGCAPDAGKARAKDARAPQRDSGAAGLHAPGAQQPSLYQLGGGLGPRGDAAGGASPQLGLRSPGAPGTSLRAPLGR